MLPLVPLALAAAPYLARVLAGDRAGDTAQAVAQAVQIATGTDDPVQAEATLGADPGVRAALSQRLAEIAVEAERVAAADRQDARARDVTLRQAGQPRRMPAALLAIGGCGAGGGVFAMILGTYLGLPEGGAVMGALIALTMLFAGVVKDAAAFEWGSSVGSRTKDARPLEPEAKAGYRPEPPP